MILALAALCAAAAQAQLGSVVASTPTVVLSTAPNFGVRLPATSGPWVIGDVAFQGSRTVSEYALRSKVRAKRGSLYSPTDIAGDVQALLGMELFSEVRSGLFAMEEPVPQQFMGIVASTSMVRLVFFLNEKGVPVVPRVEASSGTLRPEDRVPPAAVSGLIFTPTAYRGLGHFNRPGLGLDFNGVYYIGRLYGKNSEPYTLEKTNYLDRIGQWFVSADGKMQLQSETRWRPAMAAGVQGIFAFRDAPQPAIATPGVTVHVSQKSTRTLGDGYLVFSKKLGPVRSSVGFMQGNFGDAIASLTEFLSPDALTFSGHPGATALSKSTVFFSLFGLPRPAYPVGLEFVKPNGMVDGPYLINLKIGYFLHLNFDVAYLKFQNGWDGLGMFQFRYNYFPSR